MGAVTVNDGTIPEQSKYWLITKKLNLMPGEAHLEIKLPSSSLEPFLELSLWTRVLSSKTADKN